MQSSYRRKLILVTLLYLIFSPADIASAQRDNGRSRQETLNREPVVVAVPRHLRQYGLRIGGKEYPLSGDSVTVTPYGKGKNMYVELLGSDGRQLYGGFRKYEPGALQGVARRDFRIGAYLGGGYLVNAKTEKLFADRNLTYASFIVQWQPSLIGLGLSRSFYTSRMSNRCLYGRESVCGQFFIDANGAALIAEAAPFGGTPFFRRLHVALHGGASLARTSFTLSERDVNVSGSHTAMGRFGNLELRIPAARVWIDIQHSWHLIPVELKKIEYRRNIRLETHAVGVRYAF